MEQHTDYQYIQVPMNLFYLMDANCSKVFTTLIQMNTFYPKEDGYFECAYKSLEMACGMSHPVIKACLAGLYLEGLIDVISVGKGRGKHTNKYKVIVEKFKDYEKTPVGIAIMTEDKPIHQVKYKGERFQVPWDNKPIEKQSEKGTEKQSEKKVSTNIDNIENIPNIENINNKEIEYNKELSFEEFTEELKKLCYLFINKHSEYNYLLDVDCFKNNYFENVYKFQRYVNNELNREISIDDYCLLLLNYANQE